MLKLPSLGIERIEGRWGYFDKAGQLRDIDLLQLLCLTAMDPHPMTFLRTAFEMKRNPSPDQMDTLLVQGAITKGFVMVSPCQATWKRRGKPPQPDGNLVAFKAEIANWRWAGVPFTCVRANGCLRSCLQIIIHFKPAAHFIFDADQKRMAYNKLMISITAG